MNDNHKNELLVWPCACFLNDEELWIMHGKVNVLFKYVIADGKMHAIYSPIDEKNIQTSSMAAIFKVDNIIYMIPRWANYIHCYDVTSDIDSIIEVPAWDKYKDTTIFSAAYMVNGKIICVPEYYKYFLILEIATNKVNIVINTDDIARDIGVKKIIFGESVTDGKENIYISIRGSKIICCVNLETYKYELIEIKSEKVNYIDSIAYLNGKIFFADNSNSIVNAYDINTKTIGDEIIINYKNFYISTLGESSILIDSVENGNYAILNNDKLVEHSEKAIIESGNYGYEYHHGIVIEKNGVPKMYFNRHTYTLNEIQNEIINRPKYLYCGLTKGLIRRTEQKYYEDKEIFNLKWFISVNVNDKK